MRKKPIVLGVLGAAALSLFLLNASFLAHPKGALTILAHRGVHQRFSTEGLTNDTCTAARMLPPTHSYLENTIPSMRAAFDLGADIVEIDVHPTTDGEFVVFHDWTVDCRTEGKGVTRTLSLAYIKTLDVGYGYTADGGKTFPFRGKGVGMAPSLTEVLAAFPDRQFLINPKSNDPDEAAKLDAYLRVRPELDASRLMFTPPGPRVEARLRALRPDVTIVSRRTVTTCLRDYMLTGWLNIIPGSCRNTQVAAPANLGWVLWGWPNRFLQRMESVNTGVGIVAPWKPGERLGEGLDDSSAIAAVPKGWRGAVFTNAIEVTGPLLKK